MRYADACDSPSYPRLRGKCPDCGETPCICEDLALEEALEEEFEEEEET